MRNPRRWLTPAAAAVGGFAVGLAAVAVVAVLPDGDIAPGDTALPTSAQTAPSTTRTNVTTTTSPSSTDSGDIQALGPEPDTIVESRSPSWVTADWEGPGMIIERVLRDNDLPVLSGSMDKIVTENLDGNAWTPYLYMDQKAGDLIISESVYVQLGNADSVGIGWLYRWSTTPSCVVCERNQVLWNNGWNVWTQHDESRGMIIFTASHSRLPLESRIWFFPDPIEWPEASPADNPQLRTAADDAEAFATRILDAIVDSVTIPVAGP